MSDSVSLSSAVQDSLPFLIDALPEESKTELGHQLTELTPLCYFDGKQCDMERYSV